MASLGRIQPISSSHTTAPNQETLMTPKTFRRSTLGFTLVETMTALAVSGILTAVGVPQLSGVMGAKAVEGSVSSLATALRLAKSEAMKRGEPVSVCAMDPQADARNLACAPSGKDWSAGWIVFVDQGTRGRLDDSDLVIQTHQSTSSTTKVTATLRYITMQPTGISLTAASHFDFLPQGQADAYGARRVCINKPGRLRQLPGVMDCAA